MKTHLNIIECNKLKSEGVSKLKLMKHTTTTKKNYAYL
jgi:hypothetical protein